MDLESLKIELGDGLYMRPAREQDKEPVFHLVRRNYDHLRTFMEWAKPDYSRSDAEEWVQKAVERQRNGEVLNFCIIRDDRMIGTIGFAEFDHNAKVTEIGYWIDKDEQGKGITGQACKEAVELAFRDLGMNRVQIRCASGNLRSAAIPEKLGFTLEGRQRQHVIRDGKIYDFLIYGLLKNEWLERTKKDR